MAMRSDWRVAGHEAQGERNIRAWLGHTHATLTRYRHTAPHDGDYRHRGRHNISHSLPRISMVNGTHDGEY
jgi:hypothetical protein